MLHSGVNGTTLIIKRPGKRELQIKENNQHDKTVHQNYIGNVLDEGKRFPWYEANDSLGTRDSSGTPATGICIYTERIIYIVMFISKTA
jgi:hypothetical protein